jgi:hypothetical protein
MVAGAGGIEPCNNPLLHKDFSITARPFDSIFDSKAKAVLLDAFLCDTKKEPRQSNSSHPLRAELRTRLLGVNHRSPAMALQLPSRCRPTPAPADLLDCAHAIAEFLFCADDKVRSRRKIYHLAEKSGLPPRFRLGSVLCARKSTLLEYIGGQE